MPIRFFSHKAESQGHHEIRKSLRPTRASSDRAFGFTIGGILALVGLLPVISLHPPYWLLWLPATVLIIMAWLAPLKLAPLNRMWTRLGLLLQHIVSPSHYGDDILPDCHTYGCADAAHRKKSSSFAS